MGCVSSRSDSDSLEAFLLRSESRLGYLQHDAKLLDLEFGKFKSAGVISASQAINFMAKLRLSLKNSSDAPNTELFYAHFKQEDDYSYTSMAVLAVLLSNGSGPDKIKLLFESHDPTHRRVMSWDAFLELVNLMVTISIDYLSDFLDLNALSFDERDVVFEDLKNLMSKQALAVNAIACRFCCCNRRPPKQVEVETLQDNLRDPSLAALVSPTGIRKFIRLMHAIN